MAGTKVTKTCPHCGNEFCQKRPEQSFCSKRCSNQARRPPAKDRLFAKMNKTDGCWLWTGSVLRRGYGHIRIGSKLILTHRLSWEIHYGPIPAGMLVCHHCDVRNCIRPDHLFLGSHMDNAADRDRKGRRIAPRGESASNVKVTEAIVLAIRADPRLHREIAADHGLCKSAVTAIISRKNWKHVA